MRMDLSGVPALPEGALADLVFVCDVLEFVPETSSSILVARGDSILSDDMGHASKSIAVLQS
eukprot:1997804-Pleurochrysis_carterae.AAC.1